jgi:hypothetical protein
MSIGLEIQNKQITSKLQKAVNLHLSLDKGFVMIYLAYKIKIKIAEILKISQMAYTNVSRTIGPEAYQLWSPSGNI